MVRPKSRHYWLSGPNKQPNEVVLRGGRVAYHFRLQGMVYILRCFSKFPYSIILFKWENKNYGETKVHVSPMKVQFKSKVMYHKDE